MTFSQIIILVCWGIFLLYWFSNWRNVKPTKENKTPRSEGIRIIILFTVVLVFLNHFVFNNFLNIPLCQWGWNGCHYKALSMDSSPLLFQILGVFLAVAGLIIAIIARRTLARNWSPTIDLKKGHSLITTGIYSYIRHPIYTGVLSMILATLFTFQSIMEILICIALAFMFMFRIKKEEDLMTKTFPKEYPAYKKRTKTLIPFIY
jgi:protein-S-isoprenylcysteine O-methyltransferase Ste14